MFGPRALTAPNPQSNPTPTHSSLHPPLLPHPCVVSVFARHRSEADRDAALAAILRQQQLGAALRTLLPPLPGLGTTTPSSGSSSGPPLHALAGQLLEAGSSWLPRVTAAWVAGRLTNFDYLLYLNLAAGRWGTGSMWRTPRQLLGAAISCCCGVRASAAGVSQLVSLSTSSPACTLELPDALFLNRSPPQRLHTGQVYCPGAQQHMFVNMIPCVAPQTP